ncbi:hypothetical protein A4H97_33895 [Niastella yeongjuensis]|uniref:Uncharacterized protein n=1 Tax=Niastella yeongjuensis TaxID=354355 RepID=A0A1V9ECA1_9BACT|nr:hypothetical protein [Niastella yeongjuensis]OQP43594.1 hypothetical protein A4H97_33895 [Niastella yeongjuensis]SEP45875.1 hypothetical protein SAMN05660816_06372 [Niastella yeongjuensis]
MDGNKILTDILEKSEFKSKEQAIASLTYFAHPDTIRDLNNQNIFKIVRNPAKRGEITNDFMNDDNRCAQDIFCWTNKVKTRDFRDLQFNHIYSDPNNFYKYTCLSNIILTPAFLAKLTDTDQKILDLLKYRTFEIYNYNPDQIHFIKPDFYDKIIWRDFLPKQDNIADVFKKKLETSAKNRAISSVRHFGWVFNNFQPMDRQ